MKLRAGIIGLGVGESHILGYNSHPECKVSKLCDFNPEKLNYAVHKYPELEISENPDDILTDPDIDVVSIASYDNYHYEQIIKALENNKHVFVEKPLCLFKNEASKIRQLLFEKPHLVISSNLILRKSPRLYWLKNEIQSGTMGEIYYLEGDYNYGRISKITEGWRGNLDYYSVVLGGGVHIIDLLMWLSNKKVIEVAAFGNRISTEGTNFKYNDTVVAILKFENGLIGKLCANFACVLPHFHQLSLYGTKATFVNSPQGSFLYKSREPDIAPEKILIEYQPENKAALIYNFIESILNKTEEPIVNSDQIFDVLSVCFAIEDAFNKNSIQKVNYL